MSIINSEELEKGIKSVEETLNNLECSTGEKQMVLNAVLQRIASIQQKERAKEVSSTAMEHILPKSVLNLLRKGKKEEE